MANQIINKIGTSVIHVDSTDGEITLAELKNAAEATVVNADIVEIFYNLKAGASIAIDRGGTDVYKIIAGAPASGTGSNLIGHVNYRPSGLVLRGTSTSDIGVTVSGFTDSLVTLIVKKSY